MRRIKMLEYALRVERYVKLCPVLHPLLLTCLYYLSSKQLTQSTSQGVQPTKSTISHGQKEEKDGSGGSSPRSEGAFRIYWRQF